jgi:transposase
VRVTTLCRRLLDLDGITVVRVDFEGDLVVAQVALRRRRLVCGRCEFTTGARYDTRTVDSRWRGLDLGRRRVSVRTTLRRLRCPTHGVVVEGVPFARAGSRFSRDFEDLIAYLATKTDKTTITRLQRIDWDTVGRICERVVADGLDPARLDGLVSVGVDEVSWKRRHNYLTLITDHTGKKIVWGAEGKDTATLDEFFADLGTERADQLEAISMDMGAAFNRSARNNALNAALCIDPFHAVQLVTEALDVERRKAWNELRQLPDQNAAKTFKGARWVLLKRPENLSEDQAVTLRRLRNRGGTVWRAYSLKEAFRAIFAGDLDEQQTATVLDRWCSKASRSRLPAFVRVSKTIRKHRDGILTAIGLGINNGRAEGMNNHVRLIIRRAYGFHSPRAALALVMLSCGPIDLHLPHERPAS